MLNTHNRVKYRSKKNKNNIFLITHYKNKLLKEWVWCSHKGLQQSFTYLLLCLMTWIHNTTQCVRLTIKLPHLVGHFICNRLHRPKIKTWRPAQKYVTNVNSAKVQFSKWSNTSAGLELNDEGQGGQRLYDLRKSAVTHCVITRFSLKSNTYQSHIHEIGNVILPRHIPTQHTTH